MNAPAPGRAPELHAITRGIRKAVDRSGLTQTEAANFLGVTFTTVNNWYHGRTMPTAKNLTRFAHIFGVTPAWILNGGEDTDLEAAIRACGIDPASLTTADQFER